MFTPTHRNRYASAPGAHPAAIAAKIAHLLGKNNISIASVVQKERREASVVPVVMLTHAAKEKDMQEALKNIDKLPAIKRKTVLIRMEK